MANRLQADPLIRERMSSGNADYPTGALLMLWPLGCGENCTRCARPSNPAATTLSLDQMVVVGHSLGGVLEQAVAPE